jgi:ketosteroid isomerase-like protein
MREACRMSPCGDRMLSRAVDITTCLLLILVTGACGRSDAEPDPQALEDTLRSRIEEAYDFTKPDVVDRMSALYAEGGVVSASGGELMASTDSVRQGIVDFWENVGRNMRDPVWRWEEVHVESLGRDAAVLTGTWSIPHVAPTGRPHVIAGAWTAVFRRVDGEWLIVHEHLSIPPRD